jgi:hypothetical protein
MIENMELKKAKAHFPQQLSNSIQYTRPFKDTPFSRTKSSSIKIFLQQLDTQLKLQRLTDDR